MTTEPIYQGKVRNMYIAGQQHLLMKATDKVSSFDKHIGVIEGKGTLLNKMSEFWFNKTRHIIPNHFVDSHDDTMLVKKCTPIKIEMIIRGYITGTTQTSLWTHYQKGSREYCGNVLSEGLVKNQKLLSPIITPTTKGDVDVPISKDEIIKQGYMTSSEADFVFKKTFELFDFGQKLADKAGFILVDTKYEFGRDKTGGIILIDEVHTCDSSRYWKKNTYMERFLSREEPEKLDKDCVRDWVKSVCDPYKDEIPEIPKNIIDKAFSCYNYFYTSLIQSTTTTYQNHLVVIISGSEKDNKHVEKLKSELDKVNLSYDTHVSSAHRNTRDVLKIVDMYANDDRKIIWVTVAGKSNALSGVIAAQSRQPVIACPPFADKTDMMVNIHSTLQCPEDVPVMTILNPKNVALSIERIIK